MEAWLYILGGRTGKRAQNDIGPSCYLLVIKIGGNVWVYMIDCGLGNGAEDVGGMVSWNPPEDLWLLGQILDSLGKKSLDAVFLTHMHRDHVAGIALDIVQKYLSEDTPIFCSQPTAAGLIHQLEDQINFSEARKNKGYDETSPYGDLNVF